MDADSRIPVSCIPDSRIPDSRIPDCVWRADQLARAIGRTESSQHVALDSQLPGNGWPLASLIELLLPHAGVGELQLMAPAVANVMRDSRHAMLIGTPHPLYGPALAGLHWDIDRLVTIDAPLAGDRLWAAEQALRCPAVGALMVWLPKARIDQLRRLHLAAQASETLVFILRPLASRNESSPAALRIACQAAFQGQSTHRRSLELDIVKRRGPALDAPIHVDFQLPVSMRQSTRAVMPPNRVQADVLDRPRIRSAADRSAYVH